MQPISVHQAIYISHVRYMNWIIPIPTAKLKNFYIAMDNNGDVYTYMSKPMLVDTMWRGESVSKIISLDDFFDNVPELEKWVLENWKSSCFKISELEQVA